jgi:predicted Zn-dependent peptidase
MNKKMIEINQIPVTIIQTKKFKTQIIEVLFLGEFSKENATKRSLLSRLLGTATKKYPTKKAIANHLFDLYDASIGISSSPTYETNMMIASLELINEKFAPSNEHLLEKGVSFLQEMLTNPNVANEMWNESDFVEQKRILAASIKNVYNNKGRYAFKRMIQLMCPNEITSVSSLGDLEDLEPITSKTMYDFYQQVMAFDCASIYCVGDFDEAKLIAALSQLGPFCVGKNKNLPMKINDFYPNEVKKVKEVQAINQAKLVMGFRTLINVNHPLLYPALIFNGMFGGSFSSDLVQTVREKNSLCYSIHSSLNLSDKLLTISAGIDAIHSETVQKLVCDILNQYQNGIFDYNKFAISKDMMLSELIELEDSSEGLIDFHAKNDMLGRHQTVDEIKIQIQNTSIEQMQEVSKMIFLDTVFLLASEDKHD